MKEAGTIGSPSEVPKIGRLECTYAASLEWRPTTESSVNAPLVVVGGESTQLAMEIEGVREECLVEILAPKGADQAFDERVRARYEGDRLEFLDVENAQIRPPAMKPAGAVDRAPNKSWRMACGGRAIPVTTGRRFFGLTQLV